MRRFMIGTGILVVLLMVGAAAYYLWTLRSDGYIACSTVLIAPQPTFVLKPVVTDKVEFENYRQTQIALVKSRHVPARALWKAPRWRRCQR